MGGIVVAGSLVSTVRQFRRAGDGAERASGRFWRASAHPWFSGRWSRST